MKKVKLVNEMGRKRTVWPVMNKAATVVTVFGAVIAVLSFPAYTIMQFGEIKAQFEMMNSRFETKFQQVDDRFDRIDKTLVEIKDELKDIKADLHQTNELLNADLTFRYVSSYSPVLRKRIPVYDPVKRTLIFIDADSAKRK